MKGTGDRWQADLENLPPPFRVQQSTDDRYYFKTHIVSLNGHRFDFVFCSVSSKASLNLLKIDLKFVGAVGSSLTQTLRSQILEQSLHTHSAEAQSRVPPIVLFHEAAREL